MGSLMASQMVQMTVRTPITVALTPRTFVQYIEKMLAIKAKVMQPPQSPNI